MFDMFTKAVCVANSCLGEKALCEVFYPLPTFLLEKWMDRSISKENRTDFQDFLGQCKIEKVKQGIFLLESLAPWWSKRGPWTSNISISWKLVRNVKSQVPLNQNLHFNTILRLFVCIFTFEKQTFHFISNSVSRNSEYIFPEIINSLKAWVILY